MAVDEKYVEKVTDEKIDYEAILDDFGVEADYVQIGNGLDLEEYEHTYLRDMYDEDECTGKPILSEIYTTEFTDKNTGETTVNYKIDLVLKDDSYEDEKEAYIFPINLKEENIDFDKNFVQDVHNASGLYALAMGLMELKAKGISKAYNHLKIVGLDNIKRQLEDYDTMTVQVVEKQFGKGNPFNSFKIISGE